MKTIQIGKIVNTRGLKGEVKIIPNTHFIEERYGKGAVLYVGKDLQKATILRSRYEKGMVYAVFDGLEDINLVEQWKGMELFADENAPLVLEEDEVLYNDLMDCDVYTNEKIYVGRVIDVLETGANAVLRIKRNEGTVLIPFVRAIVVSVDIDDKKIIIEEMEGLL